MIIIQWSSSWSYSYPEPIPVLLFPPVIGRSWQETSASENASQGIRRRRTLLVTVENVNEVITVPAGTFSHVIKIARSGREFQVRGNQSTTFTLASSQWFAPGVGAVRGTFETKET